MGKGNDENSCEWHDWLNLSKRKLFTLLSKECNYISLLKDFSSASSIFSRKKLKLLLVEVMPWYLNGKLNEQPFRS